MKVGFTGTREGMTPAQRSAFYKFICELPSFTEFHHGACIGADEEAVDMVASIGWEDGPPATIIAHPCTVSRFVSQEALANSEERRERKPPLDRNCDIVDACDVLVAAPKGPEERRSGTWSTGRYARKQNKRIVIVWPDGKVTEENP